MSDFWIESASAPESVPIRDEGAPPYAGLRDEEGNLVLSPYGLPVDPPREERFAWPNNTHVEVKSIISGGDLEKIDRLRKQKDTDEDPDAEISREAIIHCAVLITKLVCPPGGVLTDPDTCERDETGKPIAATGQIFAWPRDLRARVVAAKRLPAQILGYVNLDVKERLIRPLPGTVTRSTATPSSAGSGRRSTQKSRGATTTST